MPPRIVLIAGTELCTYLQENIRTLDLDAEITFQEYKTMESLPALYREKAPGYDGVCVTGFFAQEVILRTRTDHLPIRSIAAKSVEYYKEFFRLLNADRQMDFSRVVLDSDPVSYTHLDVYKRQYLLIGPEKAMLIDTGCGLGDQKALVDMLTGGKDLIVVNTHLGPDHSFGNCRFSRVYCHQYEVENIKSRVKPGMFDYLFDEQGHNIWLEFDKKDLPAYKPYELVGVPDGYVFHLGQGCDVELIWTAGHAAGHAMYLDKKHGYLFAGDDVCSDVIGCGGGPRPGMFYNQYRNIETYRDCLARLVGRIGEIRYLYPGHFMVHLESHLLLDILEALDAILDDPKNCDYAEETLQNGRPARRMHKFVKGFGTIAYCENGVYRPAKGEADDQKETIR